MMGWITKPRWLDLRFPTQVGLLSALTLPCWIGLMGRADVGLIMTVILGIFCVGALIAVQFHGSQR